MPTNISALTATPIGPLPVALTEDMGTVAAVWFSYLAVVGDIALSVFATADGGAAVVGLEIYDGPAAAPTLYQGLSTTTRQPFVPPVVAGTTYFIRVINPISPTPLGVEIALSVLQQPNFDAAQSAILIGDDSFDNPPTIVATAAATVLGIPNIIGGNQFIDTVASGFVLMDDESNSGTLRRFSSDLATEFAAIPLAGAPSIDGIRSDRNDTFYVATHAGAAVRVYAVSGAGVVSGTSWVLPSSVWTLAPSHDGTILYWTHYDGVAADMAIHRWDLINDIALSDLVPATSPFFVTQDMLSLSDGTLLVGYCRIGLDFQVRHISAAGALLATYDFGDIVPDAQLNFRMSLSVDQLSFWLKTNPIQGTDHDTQLLQETRIADGAQIEANTFDTFTFGVGPVTASPTQPSRFGPGPSTPIAVLQFSGPPPCIPPIITSVT